MIDEIIEYCLSSGRVDYADFLKRFRNVGDDFQSLRILLNSDEWPAAIDPSWLCDLDSPEDKITRAVDAISLLVDRDIRGVKFLDVGCHEGYMTHHAASSGAIAVGFDPAGEFVEGLIGEYTSNWDIVVENGPYDVILIYDVLDHAEDPIALLKKCKSVLSDIGCVYVRNHPWTSRHATHAYRSLNKAYCHLVFTDEELGIIGVTQDRTSKIIHPLNTYKYWFEQSGFKISSCEVAKESVENFFSREPLRSRIMAHWKDSPQKTFPEFQMSQQFVDYKLSK